ncbi:TPA: polysaccharide pyruvyl transferase family protein [Escherichia coli]
MNDKVILYGAYDRYNYGDNLMPILLERFLKMNFPDKTRTIDFIYASIDSSDLSKYKCYSSIAMKDLLYTQHNSSIIVVGGEVLGADVGTLYTHVQQSQFYTRILKKIRRFQPKLLSTIAKIFYPAVWDYPYIPQKASFKNNVKVIYNTVGGVPVSSQTKYIAQAEYISARDRRTYEEVTKWASAELVPDSVLIASKIIDDQFMQDFVRKEIIDYCAANKFITVQACPYKVNFSAQDLAYQLDIVKSQLSIDVVLLPIGYASGHDDVIFLREVQKLAKTELKLEYELNIWEIMYFLSHSHSFYGTSLHGIITAMSFGVPHFCIDKRIEKITSFVQTWSVGPFTQPISIFNIKDSVSKMNDYDNSDLLKSVEYAQQIISESLKKISHIL